MQTQINRSSLPRSLAAPVLGLATALMLAACGGGGSSSQPDRTAGGVQSGATVNQTAFIDMAKGAACADQANKLFLIDGAQVLWTRAGSCADNAYATVLYGATPDVELCRAQDSIAGPQNSCKDAQYTALFRTITDNLAQPDLGLGAGHRVEVLLNNSGMQTIAVGANSLIHDARTVVLRDRQSYEALWREHAGPSNGTVPTVPPTVDFDKKMVLAIFRGWDRMQPATELLRKFTRGATTVTAEYAFAGKPAGDVEVAAVSSPYHFVTVDRSDLPVRFEPQGVRATLPVAWEMLAQSQTSAIETPRAVLVRDAAEFDALWKEHSGNIQPAVTGPTVDFSKNMVVALFNGSKPHPGYKLEIASIYTLGGTLWIEYDSKGPTHAEMIVTTYPAVITNRALFAVIPRSEANVQFFRHVE